MIRVRPLAAADLPLGLRLSQAAGWNQTEADWRRFLDLQPDGCFVAELDGTPVVPLPHPSGASGWLNDPANRERLATATARVREELSGVYPQKK